MRVVPEVPVLARGREVIPKARPGGDGELADAGCAVEPGRAALVDAVPMNSDRDREGVVDKDVERVALVACDHRSGGRAIDEEDLAVDAVGRGVGGGKVEHVGHDFR